MKTFELSADPYNINVLVCISRPKQATEWLAAQNVHAEIPVGFEGSTFFPTDNPDVFIWAERSDLVLLSHELIHASVAILAGAGVPITPKHDEALAYLHSHLLQQAKEKLKRRK